jgi:hypothetical protein
LGAWGECNFENDDALDWVYELEESNDLSLVAKALEVVEKFDSENYLELAECARALAATEVLAALLGKPSRDLTIEGKQWVTDHYNLHPGPNIPIALASIERIRSDSEMKELWDETNNPSIWYRVLDDLKSRLSK